MKKNITMLWGRSCGSRYGSVNSTKHFLCSTYTWYLESHKLFFHRGACMYKKFAMVCFFLDIFSYHANAKILYLMSFFEFHLSCRNESWHIKLIYFLLVYYELDKTMSREEGHEHFLVIFVFWKNIVCNLVFHSLILYGICSSPKSIINLLQWEFSLSLGKYCCKFIDLH